MAEKKKTKPLPYVLIRSRDSGVHAGLLARRESLPAGVEVTLHDSRRIWYWDGAASLSQLARDGASNPASCKFGVKLDSIDVCGVCEVIPCTDAARKMIESCQEWKR